MLIGSLISCLGHASLPFLRESAVVSGVSQMYQAEYLSWNTFILFHHYGLVSPPSLQGNNHSSQQLQISRAWNFELQAFFPILTIKIILNTTRGHSSNNDYQRKQTFFQTLTNSIRGFFSTIDHIHQVISRFFSPSHWALGILIFVH